MIFQAGDLFLLPPGPRRRSGHVPTTFSLFFGAPQFVHDGLEFVVCSNPSGIDSGLTVAFISQVVPTKTPDSRFRIYSLVDSLESSGDYGALNLYYIVII